MRKQRTKKKKKKKKKDKDKKNEAIFLTIQYIASHNLSGVRQDTAMKIIESTKNEKNKRKLNLTDERLPV